MQLSRASLRCQAVAKPSSGKSVVRKSAAAKRAAPAGLAGAAAALLAAAPARAADTQAVDTTVATVTEAVKATGQAVKGGLELLNAGVKALQEGYEAASPYINEAVGAVSPYAQEAVKATTEYATKAAPVVQETLTAAVKSGGVDVDAVQSAAAAAAKTAVDGAAAAQPFLQKAAEFVATSEPLALAEYGAGAVALYLLSPTLLGALVGGLRGYAGDVNAISALESINADGNAVVVDIRTAAEKESAGVLDLPGGASKVLEAEFAAVADRRLRGALRDASGLEAKLTALQVSALKRLGRGTKVYLLDRNGSTSKAVARELAKLGFGRVYVIEGGFGGWVSSRLLVKPAAGGGGGAGGLQSLPSLTRTVSSRRALPAGSK
ncbi:hypothetical protein Rsub_12438 [Raphidocelis subcapitata]|uniref:Rhodanese domain-containing protein n=1 Tax=Raphidocelis subcapitata TaxID=307507 RepID=A0A2V0PR46_9CHLO|nr:hypothetical protein Rsub_12438 [Raphidocelis subcapitata]|eukprot:GBF99725.1 hypothetical protein Rsub_12438 [Raphidocelis subcapitata]